MAVPEPLRLTQPDGEPIQIFLRGDEFLHWHEDKDGYVVVRDVATGAWVYAQKSPEGQLIPSAAAVGRVAPGTVGLLPKSLPESAISRAAGMRSIRLAASAPTEPSQPVPRRGVMKNLVVLVQFPDKLGQQSPAAIEALFNTLGYTVDGAVGSVRDYYREVSYGALDVQSVVTDWVTLDNGYAYYGANDIYGNDIRPREMVAEALAKLEARGFDFSSLDADNVKQCMRHALRKQGPDLHSWVVQGMAHTLPLD